MNQKQTNKLLAAVGLLIIIFGGVVIAEHLFNIPLLTRTFPKYALLSTNSAVCFVLSGCAFLLLIEGSSTPFKSLLFRSLSLSVIICATVSLAQELNSIERILDFILVGDFGVYDNRMAAITAVCFILLGLSFIALHSSSFKRIGQYLLHLITIGSFIALMGYLYDEPSFYSMSSDFAITIYSTLAFLIFSIAATQLNPHLGMSSILRGDKIGNITARKIFPVVLLLGSFRIAAMHIDFISDNFGSALFTTCFILGGLIILWLTSLKLNRIDEIRTEAENEIININRDLENMVEIRTEQLVHSNNALLKEIAERRSTEVMLREASDRFSKMFHSSPSGVAITFSDYPELTDAIDKNSLYHKVVEINLAFLEILGFECDEVVLDYAINLEVLLDNPEGYKIKEALKRDGKIKDMEAALRKKDGKIQQCILSVEPVDIEGMKHFLWVCYDNSERKAMQTQLQAAKEAAEQLAEAKEQFLANMSHEIRTPMNSIIGFTNLLKQTSLNGNQLEYLNTIHASGENLLRVINEVLDFSKLEAEKVALEKKAFNVRSTMETVYKMFAQEAREKGLRFSVTFDKNLPELIVGDETKLNQILVNLVGNALKFTSQGMVHFYCSMLEQNAKDLRVKFVVKDTGIGIADKNLDSIFERFNKANADTTHIYGGTGLGLSIVKKLVELQGGQVFANSIPGSGTEFHFILQYSTPARTKLATQPVQVKSGQKVYSHSRVLLAEDNIMNQKLAVALLKNAGCEIDIAENGMEAVNMLKGKSYDLVMMDIQMPVLDGYHAAQRIREELRLDIPIIAVTAHAFTGEREKCFSYGMNDFLTKPYTEEDLLLMLLKYLPEKRPLIFCDCDLCNEPDSPCTCDKSYQMQSAEKKEKILPLVTDLSYLQEISKGNKTFVAEMIDDFLSQNTEQLQALEYAIAKKQYNVIGKTVHAMKNAVRFVGLHEIIDDDLRAMETLAETHQDFESLRKHFRIVKTQCLLAHEELRSAEAI